VLVDGRKLAGVLAESGSAGDRLAWVVVGVGANVRAPPDIEGATGLAEHAERADRPAFVASVLREFDGLRRDPDAVLPAWRDRSETLGRRVRVDTPGSSLVGRAVDVTDDPPGGLVLEANRSRRVVGVGDCEHLRAAWDRK